MIKVGIQDRILEDGYLSTVPCDNCGKTEGNSYIVWAKTFIFGPWLFPIKWFTWDTNASVTCDNCHRTLHVSETKGDLKERLEEKIKENPLWKKNIFGILIILMISFSILSTVISGLKRIFTSSETMLTGHWVAKGIDNPYIEKLKSEFNLPEMNTEPGFLNLYEDKTYSYIFLDTTYISGKWEYIKVDKSIKITARDGSTKLSVKELTEQNLKIQLLNADGKENEVAKAFSGNGLIFEKNDKDYANIYPFKPEFNKWRIKPSRKETSIEIKNRLINLLQFLEVSFTEAESKNIESMIREKSSPFVIGSNGVGIKTNINWENTFYSIEDAKIGYELLEKSMPTKMDFNEKNIFKRMKEYFIDHKNSLEKMPL